MCNGNSNGWKMDMKAELETYNFVIFDLSDSSREF